MAVGSVETSWALIPNRGESQTRLRDLKEMVSSWKGPGTLVLVSHGEAIKPLVGFIPMQAEIVVLKLAPGSIGGGTLVGTIGAQ